MIQRLLLGAAILALAACGDAGGNGADGNGANAAQSGGGGGEMTANQVASEMANFRLDPGHWEITTTIENVRAEGMPPQAAQMMQAMRGRSETERECITPEEAANRGASFLANQRDADCTYRDFSMRGGRIAGTMTCQQPREGAQGGGEATIEMSGTFQPRSYDIRIATRAAGPIPGQEKAGTMTIDMRAQGRHIADSCPAGSQRGGGAAKGQ